MSFKVVENENVIVATVEKDELPPVTTNENTFDKLDSLNANDPVTIEGRIIAIGYNGALIYDGTEFGYITQNTSTKNITGTYKVGDVIKVNGYVSVFYGFNMASVDKFGPSGAELTVEASTLTVDDPMASLTPTEWGEEELSNYASSVDAGPYYVTVKGAKYTKSEKNNNFSVGDFTMGSILLDDDNNQLIAGKTYNLTGFMVYSVNKGSATSYKNMVLTSFEEVEVSATKVAEVTLNPTKIKVGETATVTAKDDLGNDLTDITVVPVDDTQDVVEVSGTTLKGLKADKFEFTVTSGKLAASNVMTLVVEGETTTPDEYTLVGEYNWNPGEDFAATGQVVGVNGTNSPDNFNEYLFSTNTIQDQTEITDFTSVAYCYTDQTFGTIKLGKSGESGILQLTTVNAIKKIEFNAYIWQKKTSSDIAVNDISTTMNVESNTDGKATSSVSVELLEGSNIITIESSERIIITNIKLYK